MAYIKYKELTKYFDFSRYVETKDLPKYTLDYVYDDEKVLVAYKTFRDFGLFTTNKIVLFDNRLSVAPFKEMYTIPYHSISSCSIVFRPYKIVLKFDLDSGYQLILKFVDMTVYDKVRVRLLYSCIARYISSQKPNSDVIDTLINNNIKIKED